MFNFLTIDNVKKVWNISICLMFEYDKLCDYVPYLKFSK